MSRKSRGHLKREEGARIWVHHLARIFKYAWAAATSVIAVWTNDTAKNVYTVGNRVAYERRIPRRGMLSLEGLILLVLPRQGSIEPCGSGQQSAIQSPETYFIASNGRELITVQSPPLVHHHVSTKIVQIEVREWKVASFRVCASPKLA